MYSGAVQNARCLNDTTRFYQKLSFRKLTVYLFSQLKATVQLLSPATLACQQPLILSSLDSDEFCMVYALKKAIREFERERVGEGQRKSQCSKRAFVSLLITVICKMSLEMASFL